MSAATFRTDLRFYERNAQDAISANIRFAEIAAPLGDTEHGIAIMRGHKPSLILTEQQAYRIAKDIADHLTKLRTKQAR
ncbi:hypothetical protein ACWGOE_01745 [Leucobacter chromiiresistens]